MVKIGRLKRQDVRSVWPNETMDFTPWFGKEENLRLLAETLELGPLDQVKTEVSIGNFRADVICKDINDQTVVIENQFARSDHGHLGQVLTYLAGVEDVRTIIWIAETLREEHRAALDWLNDNTSTEFAFFGVEMEVWRIGTSDPAPKFEIVVRPNDWVRLQKQRTRAAEMEDYQRRMEYWQAFLDAWEPWEGLSPPASAPNQGWMKLALTGELRPPDGGGIYVYRLIANGNIGVYLSVGRRVSELFGDWADGLEYPSLQQGVWEANRSGHYQFFKTLVADAMDDTDWQRQHAWMRDRVLELFSDWRAGLRNSLAELVDKERRGVMEDTNEPI